MGDIKREHILRQLKADLIGKDSYRGVTLTYSWLANQFGHFSLGFIPTLIVYAILKEYTSVNNPSFWAAIIVSIIWLLFELYNFLGPLLSNKQSESKRIFISSGNKYVFQPDWSNVAFDTFTDLCFFWFGSFSASLFLDINLNIIGILFLVLIVLLYPVAFWFVTKMYIQYARYPLQFRLSQWQGDISDEGKKVVMQYIDKHDKCIGKHLLIFGGRRSGKSLLGVGIGTEFSIKKHSCSYYTGMKIYNLFSLTDDEIKKAEECEVWSWRTASLLIIDDINPGNPISQNFISPEELFSIINTQVQGNIAIQNSSVLVNKNVIWIMGNENIKANYPENWKKMLIQLGVPENKIYTLSLGFNLY